MITFIYRTYLCAHARYPTACASAHCAAQHVATPNIRLNFHDQKSKHEIHGNIVPPNSGAIRYHYVHTNHK